MRSHCVVMPPQPESTRRPLESERIQLRSGHSSQTRLLRASMLVLSTGSPGRLHSSATPRCQAYASRARR